MKYRNSSIILIFTGLLVIIQLIRPEQTNPPVTAEINAPDNVTGILKKSCYDCHSNQTTWPWYSSVAPVSWLVTHNVKEGRRHLNFSGWETLSNSDKGKMLSEIREEILREEMPPGMYILMHSHAGITPDDRLVLKHWTRAYSDSLKTK